MKKCAIVVAHPDDEAIWCASLPLRWKHTIDTRWSIICISMPNIDVVRAEVEFNDSCNVLNACGFRYRYIDYGMNIPLKDFHSDSLYLLLEDYDHIFTHNSYGEYGHPHHKQVHDYIKQKYSHKKLTFFGYRSNSPLSAAHTNSISLTDGEIKKKMEAIKCYNHISDGKPYYEKLLRWMKTLPNYNFDIETFEGDLP